jgi:hypothetical protein
MLGCIGFLPMISDEAVCRVFGVSKNSLYRWQERLSHLKPTQVLYALKRRQGLKIGYFT